YLIILRGIVLGLCTCVSRGSRVVVSTNMHTAGRSLSRIFCQVSVSPRRAFGRLDDCKRLSIGTYLIPGNSLPTWMLPTGDIHAGGDTRNSRSGLVERIWHNSLGQGERNIRRQPWDCRGRQNQKGSSNGSCGGHGGEQAEFTHAPQHNLINTSHIRSTHNNCNFYRHFRRRVPG